VKVSGWHNGASAALLLATFLFIGGCGAEAAGESKQANPERHVAVIPVTKGDIVDVLHLTGTLMAAQDIEITSKIPGRVEKVLVEEGSRVKAGDALIRLEQEELNLGAEQASAAVRACQAQWELVQKGARPEEIEQVRAAVKQVEALVAQAKSGVAQANAALENVKANWERMKALLDDNSLPKQQFDAVDMQYTIAEQQKKTAEEALKMASEQLRSAREQLTIVQKGARKEEKDAVKAQLDQAKAALALAKRMCQNATITSPIAGIIAHKNVELGKVVSPPMIPGRALLHVIDVSTLKTRVNVSENKVKAVKLGQKALIALDGFPGETFSGKVSKISPVVDSRSRTFGAEIVIPNPDGKLKPGMFARVQLVLDKRSSVFVLPVEAVVDKGKEKVVFLAKSDVAIERQITVGLTDGINIEITSGVKAGEMVIVKGNLGLKAGTKISVEKE
jgi:RND family efflux transporter MFP subunit